jgi:hypothetical protein
VNSSIYLNKNRTADIMQNGSLTLDEFREGSQKDATIVSALSLYDGLV